MNINVEKRRQGCSHRHIYIPKERRSITSHYFHSNTHYENNLFQSRVINVTLETCRKIIIIYIRREQRSFFILMRCRKSFSALFICKSAVNCPMYYVSLYYWQPRAASLFLEQIRERKAFIEIIKATHIDHTFAIIHHSKGSVWQNISMNSSSYS